MDRRQTMNPGNSVPMPSSVLRTGIPQRSRQSMAPTSIAPNTMLSSMPSRGRQSMLPGGELRPPGTVSKMGSYGRHGGMGMGDQSLVMSVNRQGVLASSRRAGPLGVSSTPFKGRQSMAPQPFAPPARLYKDPRPKDKTANANNILEYLQMEGYQESAISLKILLTPTTKDFQLIFKFLASKFDRRRNAGFGGQGKKWEDEVVPWLKGVGYPFADSITKSHLQAVGSMHAWPNFLAMLDWLVNILRFQEQTYEPSVLNIFRENSNPDVTLPEHSFENEADQLEWENTQQWLLYLRQTYADFLVSKEYDPSGARAQFIARYDQLYTSLKQEHTEVSRKVAALEKEVETLKYDDGKLSALRTKVEVFEKEIKKLEVFKKQSSTWIDAFVKESADTHKQLEAQDKIVEEKTQMVAELNKRVNAQTLTQIEAKNITSEQSQLKANIQKTQFRTQELCDEIGDLEVRHARATDNVRKLIESYNKLVHQLQLHPPPERLEKRGIYLTLDELDMGRPKEGYGTLDGIEMERLRGYVGEVKQDTTRERMMREEELIECDERTEELETKMKELEKEVSAATANLDVLAMTLEEKKKMYDQELASSTAKIDKVQRHIHDLRTNNAQSRIFALDQKIQETKITRNNVMQELASIERESEGMFQRRLEAIVGYFQSVEMKIYKIHTTVMDDLKS